ncbi:exosortase [Aquitalea sp.]|uniref:exosortase n=1 Tax=Aquitalea sp. TaxID=1872623 RepID=UPI00258420B3|nr:exosortase [Aquitalea sp.]
MARFFLIIAWMFWNKAQQEVIDASAAGSKLGVLPFVLGLVMYVLGHSQDVWFMEIGSFVFIIAGLLLLHGGYRLLHAYRYPLLFILILIPLPGFLVDWLTASLKMGVSQAVEQLLYLAGYPISRSGVVLNIGQYQLMVADACSGINSMFSLLAFGLLYLYFFTPARAVNRVLLLIAVLPAAIVSNIVRVITLVLVTYYYGDAAGQGFIHEFSGLLLFGVAILCVFLFDAFLQKVNG